MKGGKISMIYAMECKSPIGILTVACNDDAIVGLWIAGQKYFGGSLKKEMILTKQHPVLQQAADWLDRYFAGKRLSPSELPLAPMGGEFRQSVWNILLKIPYGEVTTYKAIANEIAAGRGLQTMSAQAVGGAVGHNPISIIIPCHRIVGTNGSLTGYAGGIAVKQKLLALEGVDISRFFVPKASSAQ